MNFEYAQYVRGCLIVPLGIVLFTLCLFIPEILHFITDLIKHSINTKSVVTFLIAVLFFGFFLCMNLGRVLHGGIHLICEKEEHAVELQGEILEIKPLGKFSFPELKTEYGYEKANGVQFIVNGIACSAPIQGSINVGDYVTIVYLPKSGYVLSINKTEGQVQGQGDGSVVPSQEPK